MLHRRSIALPVERPTERHFDDLCFGATFAIRMLGRERLLPPTRNNQNMFNTIAASHGAVLTNTNCYALRVIIQRCQWLGEQRATTADRSYHPLDAPDAAFLVLWLAVVTSQRSGRPVLRWYYFWNSQGPSRSNRLLRRACARQHGFGFPAPAILCFRCVSASRTKRLA